MARYYCVSKYLLTWLMVTHSFCMQLILFPTICYQMTRADIVGFPPQYLLSLICIAKIIFHVNIIEMELFISSALGVKQNYNRIQTCQSVTGDVNNQDNIYETMDLMLMGIYPFA